MVIEAKNMINKSFSDLAEVIAIYK